MAIRELERCVSELGFKGCLLNPDPYENTGVHPPALGDRYWYPLYEKLCELDVPAHIHGTGSRSEREPYSLRFINEETTAVYGLVNSQVPRRFSRSQDRRQPRRRGDPPISSAASNRARCAAKGPSDFSRRMRRLYYDTVLYTPEAIELLIPGRGCRPMPVRRGMPPASVRPSTPIPGGTWTMSAYNIKGFDWLLDADKEKILADNARRVFRLDV